MAEEKMQPVGVYTVEGGDTPVAVFADADEAVRYRRTLASPKDAVIAACDALGGHNASIKDLFEQRAAAAERNAPTTAPLDVMVGEVRTNMRRKMTEEAMQASMRADVQKDAKEDAKLAVERSEEADKAHEEQSGATSQSQRGSSTAATTRRG